MKNIENKIKFIISNQLEINKNKILNNSKLIENLGADSLDIIELIMTLEEEFNIEIPDDDIEKINTIQSIIDYIIKKKNNI